MIATAKRDNFFRLMESLFEAHTIIIIIITFILIQEFLFLYIVILQWYYKN